MKPSKIIVVRLPWLLTMPRRFPVKDMTNWVKA